MSARTKAWLVVLVAFAGAWVGATFGWVLIAAALALIPMAYLVRRGILEERGYLNGNASCKSVTTCLSDWTAVLPSVAAAISATYQSGEFELAESEFAGGELESAEWSILGRSGCSLVVLFERYEGYYYGTLTGQGIAFFQAKALLSAAYLTQGGEPESGALGLTRSAESTDR